MLPPKINRDVSCSLSTNDDGGDANCARGIFFTCRVKWDIFGGDGREIVTFRVLKGMHLFLEFWQVFVWGVKWLILWVLMFLDE